MTPDLLRALLFRVGRLVRRNRVDSEIDDELQFHLDALTEENLARGMTEEEARQAAVRAIGALPAPRKSIAMG